MPGAAAAVAGARAVCRPASARRAGRGRSLASSELGPDRRHVLIKLSRRGDAAVGDPIQRGLADMAGEPEGSS